MPPIHDATEPAYKYQTPIEKTVNALDVLSKFLQSPVTIQTRELLAICPELRKALKEDITTKRVVRTMQNRAMGKILEVDDPSPVQNLQDPRDTSDGVVARAIKELRAIWPKLGGRSNIECVIDSGSEVVAINKRIWHTIGLPLGEDGALSLRSANKTEEGSIGIIKNLPIEIAGTKVYVQAQVVENADYDVLLGRPFTCALNAQEQNYTDGSAVLIFTDPVSGERKVVPTTKRRRNRSEDGVQTGF
jgi:hypothetical protein